LQLSDNCLREKARQRRPGREGRAEKAVQRRPCREGRAEKAEQRRPGREGWAEKAGQRRPGREGLGTRMECADVIQQLGSSHPLVSVEPQTILGKSSGLKNEDYGMC